MKEQLIEFKTAKLAKEKGFDNLEHTKHFYTKRNSKMFGVDEEGRAYPIKNTFKKLYTAGRDVDLKIENVIEAPTQSLLQKWLRDIHNIDITPMIRFADSYGIIIHQKRTIPQKFKEIIIDVTSENHLTGIYEEALEKGLKEALNLIK